jgi:microcystin-dependent protein
MAEPFLSEIRLMSFSFPPKGWAPCDGQLLPIDQNRTLFSLLGTTYGGDGRTTFGLPDMRGRAPVHVGAGFELGQKGGETTHTLALGEMPQHTHAFRGATNASTADTPDTGLVIAQTSVDMFRSPTNLSPMDPGTISTAGATQPHENMQPYLTVGFCIALQGIFPSRN